VFLRQFITVVDPQSLVEFCGLNCVCKPGNDEERRIFGEWVTMRVEFFVASSPSFVKFLDDVGTPVVFNALFRLFLLCSSPEILALKIAVELRSRRK